MGFIGWLKRFFSKKRRDYVGDIPESIIRPGLEKSADKTDIQTRGSWRKHSVNYVGDIPSDIERPGLPKRINRYFKSKQTICAICGIEPNMVEAFRCRYCGYRHCRQHRLPENHKCEGNPRSPKGAYRVLYSKGQRVVYGK